MGVQKYLTPLLLALGLLFSGWQSRPAFTREIVEPTFNFGGWVDPRLPQVDLTLNLAVGMEMSWVSTKLDWSAVWPDPTLPPRLDELAQFLALAHERNLRVMISLYSPPSWAMQSDGPNPDLTAEFIHQLHALQPATIGAIELFPGVNTVKGWGVAPNPLALLNLIRVTQTALDSGGAGILLIPGLQPLANPLPGDVDDLRYLDALYASGGAQFLSAIGLHFANLNGRPLDNPVSTTTVSLRHYEQLRAVMLKNGHSGGQIWVTSFSWPDTVLDQQGQAEWVLGAFQLMKAQLFLGAAFFESLNAGIAGAPSHNSHSLILPSLQLHPACKLIARQFSTHFFLIN